jgi:predicted dithiol-disulfide oxidoreductase (DUF899 family)
MAKNPKIVSHEEWLKARAEFLKKEKEFSRLRDEHARERRELPWEKVDKAYSFEGPEGKESLVQLFGRRSQLAVYHFMFAPEWEEGCPHCSFWADHYSGMVPHLAQRDVSFAVISRAPLAKIERFKKRMGWTFKWLSSGGTDFNYDFQASFRPEDIARGPVYYNYRNVDMNMGDREGLSTFYKDQNGAVFHTYSTYARGIDLLNSTYNVLDLCPKGRNENAEFTQDWVRHHDRYQD